MPPDTRRSVSLISLSTPVIALLRQRCFRSQLTRGLDRIRSLLDGVCTNWAYDVIEGECYVFAGCNNIGFDADYVQYAMKAGLGYQ